VWKATDTLLGRPVAVKRLLPHLATDPDAAARFEREAHAAASLNHPGIVTVYDTGEDEAGPYIVLELIEGETLAARSGPMRPDQVVDIVTQASAALDHAHAVGVVHRDVKPANLIVDSDGRVRLADFGIARAIGDPTTVTEAGALVGTIAYMAPELLEGAPATPASDIYSLAAVAYQLLAGRPPFVAETPAALLEAVRSTEPAPLRGRVPPDMATAIALGMSKDPSSRPGSAGELAAALTGTATLVIGPASSDVPTAPLPRAVVPGSEEPTMVGGPQPVAPPSAPATEEKRSRWPWLAAALVLIAMATAALTDDPPPASEQPEGLLAAETTTTVGPVTTTSTVAPTTTTTPPTTTVGGPEAIAGEIEALLASLQPPEFKPKDVRRVEDRLRDVMRRWESGDDQEVARELERAFDAVADLESSPERDQLQELFIQLAESMGFQVEQGTQGDEDED
jgi:serine/threonine-protein kinase